MYRATSLKFDVAGLSPIAVASRRLHNVDLTDVVSFVILLFCQAFLNSLQNTLPQVAQMAFPYAITC